MRRCLTRICLTAAFVLAAAGLVAGCSSGSSRAAPPTTTTAPPNTTAAPAPRVTTTAPVRFRAARPCTGSAPPRHWTHVVWVVMENRGLDQIDGSPDAPYLNSLGRQCGAATDYAALTH